MQVFNKKTALSAGLLFSTTFSASAVTLSNKGWDFSFNGFLNTHAVYVDCDSGSAVVAGNALLCLGENATSVSNGYSPASFSFSAKTEKQGWTLKATLAIEPGNTDNTAFNGSGDNKAYRAFFDVSHADYGSLKAGRDYGVFGIDIVLEDMSLGGVGASASVRTPLNTSLGGAGYGYIFTDRLSQITYSYSTASGVDMAIGIYQPLDLISFGGNGYTGDTGSSRFGVHGKLRFNFDSGYVSTTFINQDVQTSFNDYSASAIDVTGAIDIGKTHLVASAYSSKGMGYYGLLIDAADTQVNPRDSDGWFLQATHILGNTKVGVNYGQSNVDLTELDTSVQVAEQTKATFGVYHPVMDIFTLAFEASAIKAENHAGDDLSNSAISIGVMTSF
ncbi:porin [Glaciecola sp. 1036]|uniref:porin n=1 Tax=Alteromonadaceae TaxID=72275 RepID=UPI003D0263D3